MKKYLKIWWLTSSFNAQIALRSVFGAVIFFIAKFLRFILFVVFLLILQSSTKTIAGYDIWEMILFFATFNLIDVIPQFLFREVYRFRSYIVQGTFDYVLTKPFSPLFRVILGGSDILDIPILILSFILVIFSIIKIGDVSGLGLLLYIILVINSLLIALAFHIFTLSTGVISTAVDHTILVYRDLTQLGRFPVDLYLEPIKSLITFVIPIGIMMTFPAKALLGLLSAQFIFMSFVFAATFLLLSSIFWRFSINKYQSASS